MANKKNGSNMPTIRFYLLGLVLVFSGCAQLPSVDYDLMRAKDSAASPEGHLRLLRSEGERIAGTKFVEGNKVDLLRDGAATYPAMLKAIRSARHRVDMESYEFDGASGKQFAAELIKRRKAGVEINLIYDSWGSMHTEPEVFDLMRDEGIRVVEYNPTDDPTSFFDASINRRDHRKLLIVDSKVAFTGGVNVSEVYKLKLKPVVRLHRINAKDEEIDIDKLPWRDTHARIEGPVVADFQRLFMQVWKDQEGEPIEEPRLPPTAKRGDLMVQAIDGTPDRDRFAIYRSLLVAIELARSSVHLTTAYFVPTPDLVQALQRAARRGVDVALVLPSASDSDLALKAGHASYEDLLEAGVKIYEREGVILHAKTAVIDGIWSTVGSSNLDFRSVLYNNECNAVILGKTFGDQMEDLFHYDVSQSRHITSEEWDQRSVWEEIDQWRARLIENFL